MTTFSEEHDICKTALTLKQHEDSAFVSLTFIGFAECEALFKSHRCNSIL